MTRSPGLSNTQNLPMRVTASCAPDSDVSLEALLHSLSAQMNQGRAEQSCVYAAVRAGWLTHPILDHVVRVGQNLVVCFAEGLKDKES